MNEIVKPVGPPLLTNTFQLKERKPQQKKSLGENLPNAPNQRGEKGSKGGKTHQGRRGTDLEGWGVKQGTGDLSHVSG